MKIKIILMALVIAILATTVACGTGGKDSSSSQSSSSVESSSSISDSSSSSLGDSSSVDDRLISIDAEEEVITLYDEEVSSYDFKGLFTIYADSDLLPVEDEYLTSTVKAEAGEYDVTCSVKDQSFTVKVIVLSSNYEIKLAQESVTLNVSLVEGFDFKGLFTVTKGGKPYGISDEMISSDVRAEVGTYTYAVSVFNQTKSLTVIVTYAHEIEIYLAYNNAKILESDLDSFDFASLFIVYSDGSVMEVTPSMLDTSSLDGAAAGDEGDVILNFVHDTTTARATARVTVVSGPETVVTSKNIVSYPNGDYVDLTSLFEIKKGDEIIPVTVEMISGTINYHKIGDSVITLTYEGNTYEAVVTVQRGAFVSVDTDTVVISKGTDKLSYDFAGDFNVVINGIKYTAFTEYFTNLDTVDFNTEGVYPLTVKIPYSENPPGISGVPFDYLEKTVNYVVKANVATVNLISDRVVFIGSTGSFDAFDNVRLFINGKEKGLTDNPDYATSITTYAQVISEPIDFSKTGVYEVRMAIYVDGVALEPIEIFYEVEVIGDVVIEAEDVVVFEGETLRLSDLFTLTENGEEVEVTPDMIEGALNLYKSGMYYLTLTYNGISKTISVTVFDSDLKGTYSTFMHTIAKEESSDDEGYTTGGEASVRYDDLVIENAKTITIGSKIYEIAATIDEKTLTIVTAGVSKSYYTLYYDNGIIVLDPVNSLHMSFGNETRPLVYFNKSVWSTTQNYFEVNKGSVYVLANNYQTYSIDVGKVSSVNGGDDLWFGLKVDLVERNSADTYYEVSWGELEMDPNFAQRVEFSTYFTLNGETYTFTFDASDRRKAKIATELAGNPYAGKTFRGVVDGQSAVLSVLSNGSFQYRVNNVVLANYDLYELSNNPGSGLNVEDNTVLLYSYHERAQSGDGKLYSYKFALDVDNGSFTLLERDSVFGQYVSDKGFIFLDGYGKGIVSFDKNSFYKNSIDYVLSGQLVSFEITNASPTFAYEKDGILFLDDLGNVFTAKKFGNDSFAESRFVTMYINDGAVVTVKALEIPRNDNTSLGKKLLYDNVEIITKDGVLTGTAKENLIKVNTVTFNVAGFYQFTIEISLGGKKVTSYYSIQIVNEVYDGNALLGNYTGVIRTAYSLSVDKYGIATLTDRSNEDLPLIYTGNVSISNGKLGATLHGNGTSVILNGELLDSGLISVSLSGGITLKDYFSQRGSTVAGCEGVSLRRVQVGESYRYYLSSVSTSMGEEVTLTSKNGLALTQNGVIVTATKADGSEVSFRIDSWGEQGKGIVPIDKVVGEYVCGFEALSLDGFGNLTLNGVKGAYEVCTANQIYVEAGGNYFILVLASDGTFAYSQTALDETLLAGKSYTASYVGGSSMEGAYTVETTFTFTQDGRVLIKSSSEDYADSNYTSYEADFVGNGMTYGYEIEGKILTVTVSNGEGNTFCVFTFEIVNVVNLYTLKTVSTTLSSDAVGYFSTNTLFV